MKNYIFLCRYILFREDLPVKFGGFDTGTEVSELYEMLRIAACSDCVIDATK